MPHPEDFDAWRAPEVSEQLLRAQLPPRGERVELEWTIACLKRVHSVRDELHASWTGLEDAVDWLLAAAIARENPLLVGPPGVAKSEIAVRFFTHMGLRPPVDGSGTDRQGGPDLAEVLAQLRRDAGRRQEPRYFHYMLSRFTQVEELFGPIVYEALKQGVLVRANAGFITGPGMYGAFLDEVFKGGSAVLNSLLTLMQERRYFNYSAMQPADLLLVVAASNELPSSAGGGAFGGSASGDDFGSLFAFLDRFPIRINVPMPTIGHSTETDVVNSPLGLASAKAISRERERAVLGSAFPDTPAESCLNDLLLLGRTCLQQSAFEGAGNQDEDVFDRPKLEAFYRTFLSLGGELQSDNTDPAVGRVKWTISPRKLKALYKIALAHALVVDPGLAVPGSAARKCAGPGVAQLGVFELIWDSPVAAHELRTRVRAVSDRLTTRA